MGFHGLVYGVACSKAGEAHLQCTCGQFDSALLHLILRRINVSDFDWEDSIERIRAITSDLRVAMDRLDSAFDIAEARDNEQSKLIKEKVKGIVLAT